MASHNLKCRAAIYLWWKPRAAADLVETLHWTTKEMIRREVKLSGDTALWLLISQVDHARVSGELVRNWKEEFSPEVVEAIAHHDDGWATWESVPKLNPAIGAPYSFLEMPVAEA